VGCIHTCQGLEVDYIGVIVGPDLIVRDGRVQTVPSARDHFDKTLRGYKTRAKTNPKNAAAEADLIIKNTYRTLMTRGMKGCYVYCSDEETAGYFRDRLSPGALAAVFTKP
jgi:DUF2075 family protein